MNKKLFAAAALLGSCISVAAQTFAPEFKTTSNGNPISASVYCADPTALEYKGRLYVYGSNDHQQFVANGKNGENTYGEIKSIVVFSTADMVNWTFHGTIDTKRLCSTQANTPWYQGFGVSWAPSVVWRTTEDGTDEFFLYFCNSSHGIGVLKANSPLGPWKSPLDKLMIHRDTPGATPCSAVFDPGVVIDDNGVGWITFGGLDPVDGGDGFQPRNARIARLTPDMTAIDGPIVRIPAPYHFEANELNVIGGKFVYTYCSNWVDRTDAQWNAYKAEKGISAGKPDRCTMCYMVSDNPMDPDSWVYKGVYGPHPGMGTNNNHSHLQKFAGNYYYIYHGAPMMEKMREAGIIASNSGIWRSICVNKASVSEPTQTISRVSPDLDGAEAIGTVNPYELQEAEQMATCGGIEYEDFTNVSKNGRINTLGNEASLNMQVKMDAADWFQVRRIDFGTTGASKFMLRAKGTGTLEVRAGRKGAAPSATVEFSSAEMEDHVVELDPAKFQGVKTLYFLITSAADAYVDAWQFTEAGADGIQTVEHSIPVKRQGYDLAGRPLSSSRRAGGIIIEQTVDASGMKHYRKRLQ